MQTIISYFFLLFNQDTPKKAIKMTQRRWVPTFGPALIAILGSHDCCNSADSNTIRVFTCAQRPTPALPGDKSCCMVPVCHLMSPVDSSQTSWQTSCPLASMTTEVRCTNPFTRAQQWEWQGQAALWQFLLGHPKQSRTSWATRQDWANSSCVMKWWPRGVGLRLTNLSLLSCCQLFQDSLSILDFCIGKGISQKSRTDRRPSPCLHS